MSDDPKGRKLTASEAEQVLARAASLDAEGIDSGHTAEEIRQSALAAGIAPHAVERALKEMRGASPALNVPSASFMGLPAVPRASARVVTAAAPTVAEAALAVRSALGPNAVVSEEFGTVRGRMGETVVTVRPGPVTHVDTISDQSSGIAVTALASLIGGVLAGLMGAAAMGISTKSAEVVVAMGIGAAAGVIAWQIFWRRFLARREKTVEGVTAAVAATLEASDGSSTGSRGEW